VYVCLILNEQFNTTAADSKTYGLCFASAADWNKFGNPGEALQQRM
jgi:hypothetical protein